VVARSREEAVASSRRPDPGLDQLSYRCMELAGRITALPGVTVEYLDRRGVGAILRLRLGEDVFRIQIDPIRVRRAE